MDVAKLLGEARTIAVVGLSSRPDRDSNSVASYLQRAGYRIIPVNPSETEVLGEPAYASLRDVVDEVDIVDVFRRPEYVPVIAEDAVAIGAKALWVQSGIRSDDARRIAEKGGLTYVEDACIRTEHRMMGTGT